MTIPAEAIRTFFSAKGRRFHAFRPLVIPRSLRERSFGGYRR
jgi:hypothetical protein